MEFIRGLRGLNVAALVSLVVLFTFVKGDDVVPVVQCYVCSWQKPNTDLNLTDTCTHYNFRPEYASTVNCTTGGCEAVTYRHSKNEDIIHFRRNCRNINSRQGMLKEDNCFASEGKAEYLNVCECHSNLCNSGEPYAIVYPSLIVLTFLVVSGRLGHSY